MLRLLRKPLYHLHLRPALRTTHPRLSQSIWPISRQQHRFIFLSSIPPLLLPPVVFSGLLVALWTWKCLMMIIFQNKIIYMPGLPPNARREKLEDYRHQCGGVEWGEERVRANDGVKISLVVASVENVVGKGRRMRTVYILYFQGNASSLPPRLPFLSPIMKNLRDTPSSSGSPTRFTMVCCSYRGYWTSKGRPSEKGITKDAMAAWKWIEDDFWKCSTEKGDKCQVIIWGQSIGSGVATNLVAEAPIAEHLSIDALILETPFLSIKAMLETLYPQKWLPYRYLSPFLWNHLDTWEALGRIERDWRKAPKVIILEAGRDELVPSEHAEKLESRCLDLGLPVERKTIGGALHMEVIARPEGRNHVVDAIRNVECLG